MTEPLLFLPGMMCDARLFASQIMRFSLGRSVVFAPMLDHDNVDALANDVLKNAPPKFALAGLSMGGIVAMEVFRSAPSRITRLALLDTNPLPEIAAVAQARELQIFKAQSGKLRDVIRDEMKPNYLNDGPNKLEILDLCMEMAEDLGSDVFVRQSRALQLRRNQCDTLRAVRVPSLILCGEDDTLCPLERHTLMHDLIPGSRLSIISGAGHLPTLEQPDLVNKELEAWLTR